MASWNKFSNFFSWAGREEFRKLWKIVRGKVEVEVGWLVEGEDGKGRGLEAVFLESSRMVRI